MSLRAITSAFSLVLALTMGASSALAATALPSAAAASHGSQLAPSTQLDPFPAGTTRLAGADRYETAVAVSRRYSPKVPVVYVATGVNFPDALSAAAVAAAAGGPLLLTGPDSLPSAVESELRRLEPSRIVVLGGTQAVSPRVERTLQTIAPTTRIAGDDRFATGRGLVTSAFASTATVFIATGLSFPDALSATGAAGAAGAPVLLVSGTARGVDAATWTILAGLGAKRLVIVGGTSVITPEIEEQLRTAGYHVDRLGGATRYETSAEVNDAFFDPGTATTAFLATGTNFPDALAGAALAGLTRSPLYITGPDCTPESTHASIERSGATSRVALGGPAAIGDDAASNLGCLTWSTPTIAGSADVGSMLTVSTNGWASGTSFSYTWYANGAPIPGATGASLRIEKQWAGASISVRVTGYKAGYRAVSSSSGGVSIALPTSTTPIDSWNCPPWAPIKGNRSSWIYHVPGGAYYDRTKPEECFATETAAVNAGYRKSKR